MTPPPEGRFIGACYRCKSQMWLPTELYVAAQHSASISFFCPYGHAQIFTEGESEENKLRRERDRLKQQMAQKDDEHRAERDRLLGAVAAEKRQSAAYKASATKARQRAATGTCPCCQRSFSSEKMAAHMKTKHPEFKAEEVA